MGLAIETNDNYSTKGADSCIKCHDEDNDVPIFPIFKTKHAQMADPNSPFANKQCESCHGAGKRHIETAKDDENKIIGTIYSFKDNDPTDVDTLNKQCLVCHKQGARVFWEGGAHQINDIKCVNCHIIHSAQDNVLSLTKQNTVCFTCHKKIRADTLKRSTHPLRQGRMNCADCHESHGDINEFSLITARINDTCYSCHAEKRGPVLWPHEPVVEDCTICHSPHGSNHAKLLKSRPTFLCKQCHSPQGHPSLAPSGTALPNGSFSQFGKFLTTKGCINCHINIHGSNHPSGVKFIR